MSGSVVYTKVKEIVFIELLEFTKERIKINF